MNLLSNLAIIWQTDSLGGMSRFKYVWKFQGHICYITSILVKIVQNYNRQKKNNIKNSQGYICNWQEKINHGILDSS